MEEYKYHSALKIGLDVLEDVEPLDYFEHKGNVGIKHDFVKYGLPPKMTQTDIIWGECPWPQGFKVFDQRAGELPRSYKLFQDATAQMIKTQTKPVFLILGKILLNALPKPVNQAEIKLNKGGVILAWWNIDYNGPLTTNVDVTHHLGQSFKSIGDFCCGYGEPLFSFLDGGGKLFVGSDHNGKCIRVLESRTKKRYENLS